MAGPEKAAGAYRTIGELAAETGLPQHKLRYWEQRFPQLRPLQRAGLRRYYRPEDVALVRRIHDLLDRQGYTIGGVQKLLSSEKGGHAIATNHVEAEPPVAAPTQELKALRAMLSAALAQDAKSAG
ncbi:MerR family transcriptional regulator [Sphingomonas baiyangensis]|uniref:MerR family transcriptional regulator n=1 Tax=Sphingomonas baiyangensis TaxID=2572576 RepID=A0A4U1L6C8_9SPHN|nr:MerR family transcriptional regulator [Sphingomonas baiyangensis]TKD51893.1 MerR family transcriptional regulator [Sphingomonas baiyangensis]